MSAKVLQWTPLDIPDLTSTNVLVTGATSGLGLQTALVLAIAGARVFLTGRNETAGNAAVTRILKTNSSAKVEFYLVDHLSLSSIEKFSNSFNSRNISLDILINNAGIYAPKTLTLQEDGIEVTWMTNYLSHFVLTGRLLPSLRRSSKPRVVNVGSMGAHLGQIHWNDLNLKIENAYASMKAYAQSKVAQLAFAQELQKRKLGVLSLAAHPGLADTKMAWELASRGSLTRQSLIKGIAFSLFMKSVEEGAWPHLAAATSEAENEVWYYGPGGLLEFGRGVKQARLPWKVQVASGNRLWKVSEQMGNFTWNI